MCWWLLVGTVVVNVLLCQQRYVTPIANVLFRVALRCAAVRCGALWCSPVHYVVLCCVVVAYRPSSGALCMRGSVFSCPGAPRAAHVPIGRNLQIRRRMSGWSTSARVSTIVPDP